MINMDSSIETKAQILTDQSQALDETSPNANSPILCLPPALRRRIYLHADILVRFPNEEYAVLNLSGGNSVPSL